MYISTGVVLTTLYVLLPKSDICVSHFINNNDPTITQLRQTSEIHYTKRKLKTDKETTRKNKKHHKENLDR
jgi:hypothetical protein